MSIEQLFNPSLCAVCKIGVTNKKKVLEKISKLSSAQNEELKYHHILDSLQRRERIGNTALGKGIAIPHARVAGAEEPICTVLFLPKAIDFSAPTQQMVDLIFGLIVPEDYSEQHLQLLASLSEKLQQEGFCAKLRTSTDSQTLYANLVGNSE